MNEVHTPGTAAYEAVPTESGEAPTTLEPNFDPIEFYAPPPARGHWISLVSGCVLLGLGTAMAAVGAGLFSAPGQITWLFSQASALGLTPALTALAGLLMFGVGLAQRQTVRATQRLHDELARQPSPIPFLEEVDFQQQNLHVNLVHVENRVRETLNEVLVPLHQGLQQMLGAERASTGDGPQEALWRLAASLDQVNARLDQVGTRLEQCVKQRVSELGEEIRSELADSTSSLTETLRQPLEELCPTGVASVVTSDESPPVGHPKLQSGEPRLAAAQPELPTALPTLQGVPEPSHAEAPPHAKASPPHAVGAKPLEQRSPDGPLEHLGLLDELDPPQEANDESRGGYNPYEDAPRHPWSGSPTSQGGSIFDGQVDGDEGPLNLRPNGL